MTLLGLGSALVVWKTFWMLISVTHHVTDYDALRALDADNAPDAPSMSEEEINALPVHKYKAQLHKGSSSSRQRQEMIFIFMVLHHYFFTILSSVFYLASSQFWRELLKLK